MNRRPGECLRHPLVVGMLFLWIINDHVLKAAYGNFWTGKLSDVAGLVVFPLIPLALYEFYCAWTSRNPRLHRMIFGASMAFTASLLIAINLSEACSTLCCEFVATIQWPFLSGWALFSGQKIPNLPQLTATPDPTDLFTLPALLIPLYLQKRPDLQKAET